MHLYNGENCSSRDPARGINSCEFKKSHVYPAVSCGIRTLRLLSSGLEHGTYST